ncbi:MAG: flavin reductase family protein [Candidatus Aenigmatarchaeota archaeon]
MVKKFYYILYPRNVYVIGVGSVKNNEINFMSACWVMPVATDKKLIAFSCHRENYSFELIEKYKTFSVNVTDNIDLIWKLGTTSGREINKAKEFDVKFESGKVLDVPILKNCLAFLEAKVINYVDVSDHRLYIAEVMNLGGDIDDYGLREYWRVPLHKGGKVFAKVSRELKFI